MNQENNLDNIDKMLYEYFDNNNDVPNYIHETIHTTLQKEEKRKKIINSLKRVAMIIVSFGVMTTSIVFADDIINFITSLFTNSTDGIDAAVQNGYVQTVDMEYVYDNDIGVKVDNLVLDDTNLDISFIYNYQGNEEIDSLELYEYIIKDENDNILYELTDNVKGEFTSPLYVSRYNETIFIENNMYKDSIIYTSKNFPDIKKLKLDIKKFNLIHNEKSNIISGNWNIEINLDEKFSESKSEFYSISYNEYINSSKIELTETSLKVNLEFNIPIKKKDLKEQNSIILRDVLNNEYIYNILNLKENINTSTLYLEYDISKHFENINEFELLIKIPNEDITLKIIK